MSDPAVACPHPSALAVALGEPAAPRRVSQLLYNLDRGPIERMIGEATLDNVTPWYGILQNYAEDMPFVEVLQPDLLRWLLPYAFGCWQRSFTDPASWSFLSVFHRAVLARPRFIAESLGDDAERAVRQFVVETLASEATRSTGPDGINLGWVRHLVTLTAAWPEVSSECWHRWIGLAREYPSAAWSLLGYLAHLAWPESENPLDGPGYLRWRPWEHALMEPAAAGWDDATCAAWTARLNRPQRSVLLEGIARCLRATPAGEFAAMVVAEIESERLAHVDARLRALQALLADPSLEKWWPDELGNDLP